MIKAPLEAVWAILRDFNGHDRWHPAIATSELEHDHLTDQVGCVRNFVLTGGERLREQLLELDDDAHRFRYAIVESDVPLLDYVAEVALKRITDGDRTFCSWRSRFRTPSGRERELADLVATGVYDAGFAAIRERLVDAGSVKHEPPAPAASARVSTSAGTALRGRAVTMRCHGDADVLDIEPIEAPPPAAGEVRLEQRAAGVNFIDVYCRRGDFTLVSPGGVLGMEASARVVEIGTAVSGLSVGDRVGYAVPPPGGYASVRTMPADRLVRLPDALDDVTAAAILLKGITAAFLLHRVHVLEAGQTALIYAPAGGVGQLLVPWAKALGARVIGVTSTERKAAFASGIGCDEVILRGEAATSGGVAARVRELTDGRGADVVYDAVGHDSWDASIGALATHGHLVSFGQASGDIGPRDVASLSRVSARVSRPNYGHFVERPEDIARASALVFDALADGILGPPDIRVMPLAEVRAAHRALEAGETVGATVLDLTDDLEWMPR